MTGRVLIVDDDASMCGFLKTALTSKGYAVDALTQLGEAVEACRSGRFDVVVTDLNMRGGTGLDLVRAKPADLPAIVMTAFGSMASAIEAIRAGAYDFITKPLDIDDLAMSLDRALDHRRLIDEVRRLTSLVAPPGQWGELVGTSPAMQALYRLLDKIKDADATVLVRGETGTGKELVARSLHAGGPRASGPFVAINCAATPAGLIEGELFGHVRGAFTDARGDRTGLFVKATGGTLFLDEVGELPLALQATLLRALQERVVRPLGGNAEVKFDARIIAATNRDLETAVEEGRFRADLFHRLDVLNVDLPPLRSRGTDVLTLAQHFVQTFRTRSSRGVKAISHGAARKLLDYGWPGNVRELANAMERAVTLAEHEDVMIDDLPARIQAYLPQHVLVASEDPAELLPVAEVEKRYILRVLELVGGHRTKAAQVLGLDRKTLYRKLEGYRVPAE